MADLRSGQQHPGPQPQTNQTEIYDSYERDRIVNNWNSLSDHVVAAETLNAFEAWLYKLWKNRMYEVDT